MISKQEHELNYVLKIYNKRQTQDNRDALCSALDAFQKDSSYDTYFFRDGFYNYVDKTSCLNDLE
jgi:hypothetical protein